MSTTRTKKIQNENHRGKGFTLLEVVLVVSIISIVFTAVYALYANTIRYDAEARYEMLASNLSQEGIELVRNMRDTDRLVNPASDWMTPFEAFDIDGGPTVYNIPTIDNNGVVALTNITADVPGNSLIYDDPTSATSIMRNCVAPGCGAPYVATPFRRWIIMEHLDDGTADERLRVTCRVYWSSFVNNSITRQVETTSIMTPWNQ